MENIFVMIQSHDKLVFIGHLRCGFGSGDGCRVPNILPDGTHLQIGIYRWVCDTLTKPPSGREVAREA